MNCLLGLLCKRLLLVHQMILRMQAEEQERDLSLGVTSEGTQDLGAYRRVSTVEGSATWEFYADIPRS